MTKKKILGLAIAAVIAITSFASAFAAETTTKGPDAKQAKIEARQAKQAKRLDKFKERASKLGIDIEGLSLADAKAKIKEAVTAKKTGKYPEIIGESGKIRDRYYWTFQ